MRLFRLCLLLLLISCGNNKQQKNTAVPFELTGQGHILVKATVNGVEGNFIFDTGAGLNMFFKTFAQKINGQNQKRFFIAHRSTGEPVKAPLFKSDEIVLGEEVYTGYGYTNVDFDIPGLDGILSLQMFTDTDVTIDYNKKELIFGEVTGKNQLASIDIQIADYAGNALDIFTIVKIDDNTDAQVMLDAGAGAGVYWLNRDLMDTLKFNFEEFVITEKESDFVPGHKNTYYKGQIQSISNSIARLERPDVTFVDGLIYEGKFSIDWLGKVIAISLKDKKIYQLEQ